MSKPSEVVGGKVVVSTKSEIVGGKEWRTGGDFRIVVGKNRRTGKESTRPGYIFIADGVVNVMQAASVIASHYTADELLPRATVRTGDILVIDGVEHKVGKLGDYSDAGKAVAV